MLPIFRLLRRRRQNLLSIRNRISNRQQFNSFDLSHARFIELYRLNKILARQLIEELRPHISSSTQRRGVSIDQKVLSVLRFYAIGSYQRSIGEEYNTNISQTSAHRYIHEVTLAIVEIFGHTIKFPQTRAERVAVKQQFMENFGFPGVLGAIDCTHVAILKPAIEEHNYINRKGYHSINVQLVCDATLKIRNVNSNYGGSTHDSFIFRNSALNTYLHNLEIDEMFWLLGDSGYAQLPYLMTPFRNPLPHTAEANYNQHHIEARNCVERCIGLLKMRFRCLLKERSARYTPQFVSELFKACSILHNMCLDANIEIINPNEQDIDDNIAAPPLGADGVQRHIAGQQARQNLLMLYFNN